MLSFNLNRKHIMPTTIKSVCDQVKGKLCKVPIQDFGAAAAVREVQRALDPKGTKRLTRTQVMATKAFLDVVVATAYH
ncbi:MAG: hypothetical protein A2825_01860 [Candidatus Taylorbacteria bacterium RIFCSPHIGHO2_01_FULL_43_120]|nr:MAG: hypothetical protein A2825_01860 [Candidatus Taylorbacteria bacterium RIFCSPHIGHO2_01_FULL_43_120]